MQALGDVLNRFLKSTKWKSKLDEIRLRSEWEQIMGKTIAKYTRQINYCDGILTIYTDVAPLKQELHNSKQQIIAAINDYLKESVIKDVHIR